MFRAGFVAIVGLPNVGKSTLLNRILGQKIAIASPKPQTTRNRILGVHTTDEGQLVLIDTPGLARRRGRASQLERYMVDEALAAVEGVDGLLMVIEGPAGGKKATDKDSSKYVIGAGYDLIRQTLAATKKPVVAAINKIDRAHNKQQLLPMIEAWSKVHPFAALVPISAATGAGVERLENELRAILPEGEKLFPEDMVTDRAERWLAAEMVREQVFLLTRQEIPYGVAVTIDTFTERPAHGAHVADVVIEATIHVEKDPQKAILIGEGGRMIREIGTRARAEIGVLLGCPVHLTLFVRLDADWTSRAASLRDLGYE